MMIVDADEGIFIGNPNVPHLGLNEFLAYNQNYVHFPVENNVRIRLSLRENTSACGSTHIKPANVGCFGFLLNLLKIR